MADGKPIMYEKAFLQDVAAQNFSRYNVSFVALERLAISRGQALAVNSSRWLSSTVGNYLDVLNAPRSTAPVFSPPRWDPVGKGEGLFDKTISISIFVISISDKKNLATFNLNLDAFKFHSEISISIFRKTKFEFYFFN